MREVPAGTLLRVPTAMEGPESEGTFECLLLTNLEKSSKINPYDRNRFGPNKDLVS